MATPRFRKPKPFGNRSEMSGISEPKKSFYIICEGVKTENQYFNGVFNHRTELKIHQLIDIVVIEQEKGQEHIPHPVHIVNGCINIIDNEDGTQTDLINYDSEIDEIGLCSTVIPKHSLKINIKKFDRNVKSMVLILDLRIQPLNFGYYYIYQISSNKMRQHY